MSADIGDYGLPIDIVELYRSRGLSTLFQWQVECLAIDGVLVDGRNLVYSAPTSSGKTFVSELIAIRRTLATRTKTLFVLPYVAVAQEKLLSLQVTVDVAWI